MNLWTTWLDALRSLVDILATEAGLGLGLGIIAATLLFRTLLLPISWQVAFRGVIRQKKLTRLQPELKHLQEKYAKDPKRYMQEMSELYRKHDLSLVDGKGLLGALVQAPLFIGMFQALRNLGNGATFLWVSNLLKPDALLALIAGATTALMISVNPDMPEQMRMLMIAIPTVIAIVAALKVCSALSLYWIATNCFSAAQTTALHWIVGRKLRAGTLKI
jgi:YidC/Oxa1 family membrane protein insertase